jgi:hypothetical protein
VLLKVALQTPRQTWFAEVQELSVAAIRPAADGLIRCFHYKDIAADALPKAACGQILRHLCLDLPIDRAANCHRPEMLDHLLGGNTVAAKADMLGSGQGLILVL